MKRALFVAASLLVTPLWGEPKNDAAAVEAAGQEFLLRAAEYAGYQIEATDKLRNQRLVWTQTEGEQLSVKIGSSGRISAFRAEDAYFKLSADVFELADNLFYASFSLDDGQRALTLVVDRESSRVIAIESRRPDRNEGTHRAQVSISQGQLGNESGTLAPLPITKKMTGVRLTAHYSNEIAYEHIYLNPHRVTWHGVTGPEAGVADTERYEAYEIRDEVFLVSWSEKVLTTHMIFLFNFVTDNEIGTIFGYEPEHDKAVLETIGARTEVMQGPID